MADEPKGDPFEAPHFPAPWEASGRSGILKVYGMADQKQYKQREVCRIYGGTRGNVNLIVAAPDLLAACEAMLAAWNDKNALDARLAALGMAKAAVAKARGGEGMT